MFESRVYSILKVEPKGFSDGVDLNGKKVEKSRMTPRL